MKKNYPAIVVQNHRYRGPMESKKDGDFIEDVFGTITHLKRLFNDNGARIAAVARNINDMNREGASTHVQLHLMENRLNTLKGGELR